ncbi:MAG: ATP-binding protein [Gemmatimonadota bacterium]|nr:ATP-binding protein [Gemmatimonadota bacterium]
MRLAQRLLLWSTIVITALVVVAVLLSGRRLRSRLGDLAVSQLTREAQLVSSIWTPAMSPDSLADAIGRSLGHRVTLIDSTGRVIGDSEFDGALLAGLQNHATRPEVLVAHGGGVGVSMRPSPSAGDRELYVAVPMKRGVARVSIGTLALDRIVEGARQDVLLSGLGALVVALVLAALFSRAISAPVVELRDVARAIADGDLSRRPALSAPGEVGDLASAVRRMSEQLESRLTALQDDDALLGALVDSLHEGVIAVDVRRQVVRVNDSGRRMLALRNPVPFSVDLLPRDPVLRDALAQALSGFGVEGAEMDHDGRTLALTARPFRERGAVLALYDLTDVRRLEAVRRDFVANVSHELKTPLTVIGGFAETLATDTVTPEQQRAFVGTIRSNTWRMQRIVDDLLDLSRIESGGWVPSPERVGIAGVAREAFHPFEDDARARDLQLELEVDPAMPSIVADPTALRQILSNLVENAVRHTSTGGRVTIISRAGADGVWLGVRDSGAGIPPAHLSRIFERFYRVDVGRSRAAGGTGLGLAVVRHLAEAHGGSARAESVVGRGTTVEVFFPESRVTPAPARST